MESGHYSDSVEDVKRLKRQGKLDEAKTLLHTLIDATEDESRVCKIGVAPWYYEQLAIVHRKEKRYDLEVEVLERYERQIKAPGVKPEKLAVRLTKARTLLKRINTA